MDILLALSLFFRVQAIVTMTAIILRVFFPEVMEQEFSPANGSLCIRNRFHEQVPAHLALALRFIPHEFFKLLDVVVVVKGYTFSFQPVTTGSPCFLVVIFK